MTTLTRSEVVQRMASVRSWYHRIELHPGIVTPGVQDSPAVLKLLQLPVDCRGLRVLDLGTADGFFAFEMERRGAEVVAIDFMPPQERGFAVAAEAIGSRVRYVQDNVYRVSAEKYGTFDIVLFLGLLYHMPDPLEALRVVRTVRRGSLYVETVVIDNRVQLAGGRTAPLRSLSRRLMDVPLMQFYPKASLNNDPSNFWGPNVKCVESIMEASNFELVFTKMNGTDRAVFRATTKEDAVQEHARNICRGLLDPVRV